MGTGGIDAAHADHRRAVDLVAVPVLRSLAGLVHDAEGAHGLFPLLAVDAGLRHEVENVGGRIVVVVGMLLINHALEELHVKLVEQAERFKREVGLREGLEFLLPGNRAHADGHVLGRGLGPFFKMRRKLQAVRAGIGEELHDFDCVARRGRRRIHDEVFLTGGIGRRGKKGTGSRGERCGKNNLATRKHCA